MTRPVQTLIGVVLLAFGAAPMASAQPMPGPLGQVNRPAFSSYLNLTRPGATPALNYFGMVQPQTQFRQSFQNLQGAVNSNFQAIGGLQNQPGGIPATGHGFGFMNYRGYFQNTGMSMNQTGMGMNQGMRFNGSSFRAPTPGSSGANPGGGVRPDVRR